MSAQRTCWNRIGRIWCWPRRWGFALNVSARCGWRYTKVWSDWWRSKCVRSPWSRFATYKRANLLWADIERLATLINDPKRPVQFVFAGKAHPRDDPGKRVLQQIPQLMRDRQLGDKFVFVEDYDINVERHFVQGVDVWLNNPRRL